jgi:hypothetical protein
MQSSTHLWRTRSRDLAIVWTGIVLGFVGWVASEYGYNVQRTTLGSIAVTGNAIVVIGLIIIAAGFGSVARTAKNLT